MQSYHNPYFYKKRTPKTSRFYYSLLLLGLTLCAWIYFLFCSNTFKITEWEIKNLKKYNKSEVEDSLGAFFQQRKFWLFKYSNMMIFNAGDLEKYLADKFVFDGIRIEKYYPSRAIIYFEEKKEKLALYNKDNLYILSDDGTVLSKKQGVGNWYAAGDQEEGQDFFATSTPNGISFNKEMLLSDAGSRELPPYPIFCDAYYDTGAQVGDQYPAKKTLGIVYPFIDELHSKMPVRAEAVLFYKNKINPKIVIYTKNGWRIYLNNEDDGERQFYKLFLAFNNKIKDINKPLEYIDLRFGDNVYIK